MAGPLQELLITIADTVVRSETNRRLVVMNRQKCELT